MVYANGGSWVGGLVVVRALPNSLKTTRYGFSVSKKVGNAVIRNKVKRRLKEITRQIPVETGWDIVIIARSAAARADYSALKKAVSELIIRAHLLKPVCLPSQ